MSLRSHARSAVSLGVLFVVLAASVVFAVPARAHDQLLGSDPASDASLTTLPKAVTLTYSESILNTAPRIVVTGPTGVVADGPPTVADRVVSLGLPNDLPDGRYTVAWRVVSSDGHPISDQYQFTLSTGRPAPASSPSAAAQSPAAPTAAETGSPGGGLWWAIGAGALVIGVGASVWLRRRSH